MWLKKDDFTWTIGSIVSLKWCAFAEVYYGRTGGMQVVIKADNVKDAQAQLLKKIFIFVHKTLARLYEGASPSGDSVMGRRLKSVDPDTKRREAIDVMENYLTNLRQRTKR